MARAMLGHAPSGVRGDATSAACGRQGGQPADHAHAGRQGWVAYVTGNAPPSHRGVERHLSGNVREDTVTFCRTAVYCIQEKANSESSQVIAAAERIAKHLPVTVKNVVSSLVTYVCMFVCLSFLAVFECFI